MAVMTKFVAKKLSQQQNLRFCNLMQNKAIIRLQKFVEGWRVDGCMLAVTYYKLLSLLRTICMRFAIGHP